MAKIKKEDLEHLTNIQLREFYNQDDWRKLPSPILEYVNDGHDRGDLGGRLWRVQKLIDRIVIERFATGMI